MSNSYVWENNKKIYKKNVITWFFGIGSSFRKSSKQGGCYLVLLKVQYKSSHAWILSKTLSLDCRPKSKAILLKSNNLYNLYKTNKNCCRYFD